MTAHWSRTEECWTFDCVFGCHGTDYESEWSAERGELLHDCMHARFPGGASQS